MTHNLTEKRKAYCKAYYLANKEKYKCEHNIQKSRCKECGGSSICEHNKRKSRCRDCKGSQICEHNKLKSRCIDCKGSEICEHNKRKSRCKYCKGSEICKHNILNTNCKECKGSSFCEHNKVKSRCKICGGSSLCKSSWCETRGHKKYKGYCLHCCIQICPEIKVSRNYKTKEIFIVDIIKNNFSDFTWINDKKVQNGCSNRRPDLLLDMGSHIIIVEIDENKHNNYDCNCENKRLMEISQDLNHRPIIFIRFNPDSYINNEGLLIKSCWRLNKLGIMTIIKNKKIEWNERIDTLNKQIQYWIDNQTEKTIEIIELFY